MFTTVKTCVSSHCLLTLINVACQRLLNGGLVGDYSTTSVADLSPSPQCPAFSTILFCIETVQWANKV